MQQQLERKSLTDSSNVKVERQFKQITGPADAIDAQLAIGDASERFIRKESNTSASHHSQYESQIEHELTAEETEDSESNDVCSVIEVEQPQLRQTSSSTTSRSSATRSFLNTSGEDRHVSGVDDVLERMRNADNGKWIFLLSLLFSPLHPFLVFFNLLLIVYFASLILLLHFFLQSWNLATVPRTARRVLCSTSFWAPASSCRASRVCCLWDRDSSNRRIAATAAAATIKR